MRRKTTMRRKTATKSKPTYLQAIVMYWQADNPCIYIGFQGLPAWCKPHLKQIEPGVYRTIELEIPEEWTLHVIPAISYTRAHSSSIIDPRTDYKEEFDLDKNEDINYAAMLAQEDQRRAGLQKDREVIMRVIDLIDERLNDDTPLSIEDLSDAAQALHSCTESLAMIDAQEQGKPVHLHW